MDTHAGLEGLDAALRGLARERTQTLPALHALHALQGYLSADGMERIADWVHAPKSELYAVATSYAEFRFAPPSDGAVRICRGLSCLIAGGAQLAEQLRAEGRELEEHECMFLCAAAPLAAGGSASIEASLEAQTHESARSVVPGGLPRVTARRRDEWRGWAAAAEMPPGEVIEAVGAAGLRGRGGAYFPVHLKWRGAADHAAQNGEPLLIINAEEGEPGVFKDRALMEHDPTRLIEGIRIACYALGARKAYCYINGMADRSAAAVAGAAAAAGRAGRLARSGSGDPGLEIEIRRGAGGYVCGEESVIMESIEGRRAVPRLRPPLPTERGLWGRPTVINNVETLANLPDILEHGAEWFRETGTADAPGTKLLSISGAFERRGLLEAELGAPLSEIIDLAGPSEDLIGVAIGGPSGGFLAVDAFDTPILPGPLDGAGAVLGAGGIIGIPRSFGAAAALAVQAQYNAAESCGKCTPCREGAGRLADALERLNEDGEDPEAARDINTLLPLLASASLCGHGQMSPNPVTSARRQFGGFGQNAV